MIRDRSMLSADGGAGAADELFEVPRIVYRDDPFWIPESVAGLERQLARGNPWYEQGEARWWCAPGDTRLAAFFSPDTRVAGRPVAFFGLWETTGDLETNRELFAEAEAWAAARHVDALIGPIDFSTFGRYRLATGGDATSRPFLQEPYNPPTYPGIVTALGYDEITTRYFTHVLEPRHQRQMADTLAPAVERFSALGYRVEPITLDLWMRELPALHALCDSVFAEQFAYTPLSFEVFAAQCGEAFFRRIEPRASAILWAPDGMLAGFNVNYPDWSPLLAQDAGDDRLDPDDIDHDTHLPKLAARPHMDWLGRTGGVAPEHRMQGAAAAVIGTIFQQMVDDGRWRDSVWGMGIVGNGIDHLMRDLDVTSRFYSLYRKELR
jgi:hypothetical protein